MLAFFSKIFFFHRSLSNTVIFWNFTHPLGIKNFSFLLAPLLAADIVSGAYQIGGPIGVRPSSVRLSSTIHLNRYSSYSSQPILTKLGTRLEPLEGQKLLEAEFWIFALCGKKQTTLSFFSNLFKSLLLLQFSTNLNQTWHKVRTLSGAQNVGSRILNFCLWMGISRRLC